MKSDRRAVASRMTREPPIDTVIRHLINAAEIARKRRMHAALCHEIDAALAQAWVGKDRQRARDRMRRRAKK